VARVDGKSRSECGGENEEGILGDLVSGLL